MKILFFCIILLSATMGVIQRRNSINIEINRHHHVNMINGPDNNPVANTKSPKTIYGVEKNIFEFDLRGNNRRDRPPHINIYYKPGVTNRENPAPHIHIYCPCGVDGPEKNKVPPTFDFYIGGETQVSQHQDPLNNSRANSESPTNTYGVEENIFEFDLRGNNNRDQAPHIHIYYQSVVYGTGNNKGKSPLLINIYYQPGVLGPENNRNPQAPPLGPSVDHWNNYMNNVNTNFPSQPWANPFYNSRNNTEQPANSYGMAGNDNIRNPLSPPLGPSGERWNNNNPNFPMGNYRPSSSWYNGPPLPVHGANDPDYVNYINTVYPNSNFPMGNYGPSTNSYYGSGFGGTVNNRARDEIPTPQQQPAPTTISTRGRRPRGVAPQDGGGSFASGSPPNPSSEAAGAASQGTTGRRLRPRYHGRVSRDQSGEGPSSASAETTVSGAKPPKRKAPAGTGPGKTVQPLPEREGQQEPFPTARRTRAASSTGQPSHGTSQGGGRGRGSGSSRRPVPTAKRGS
ncbi:uncharacterized protein LOC126846889 [Adelges cooleyi]|uniref:uncharacterized protein LOC126846889 n=1 Tax=Adelges cooleyi TaxID=133065 RepID=UPI00217F5A18|nr:uncharacterized protein LOC126846889 [Adelges cooleyi]